MSLTWLVPRPWYLAVRLIIETSRDFVFCHFCRKMVHFQVLCVFFEFSYWYLYLVKSSRLHTCKSMTYESFILVVKGSFIGERNWYGNVDKSYMGMSS